MGKSGKNWKALALILFALVAVYTVFGHLNLEEYRQEVMASAGEKKAAPKPGRLAPNFTLPDLNSVKVDLSSYKGRVVLVTFWATWCTSCLGHMRSLETLYKKIRGPKFGVLAISTDRGNRRAVESYAGRCGLTYPVLLDSKNKVADTYRVWSTPTTFIVGKDGVIVEKIVGERNWLSDRYVKKLQKLIEEE